MHYKRDRKGRPQPHPDNLETTTFAVIISGEHISDAFREYAHSQSPINLANLGSALAEYATTHAGFTTWAVREIVEASEFLEAEHKARRERLAE